MVEVILRPLEASDYEAWLAGFLGRKPAQSPYDKGQLDMTNCDKVWFSDLVDRHRALREAKEQYIYAIFDKTSGHHAGALDVVVLDDKLLSWAEFGYLVHNQYWRQGYGLAALKALIQLNQTDLHFHRLEAHVRPDNLPSKALLTKVGFAYEGRRMAFLPEETGWEDADVYVYIAD